MIPKRIFISRPIQEVGKTLQDFASNGGELISEALVNFQPVSFDKNLTCEVIFFSSIRAAACYFNQEPIIPIELQYACAGQETAEKLKNQFQISCDFIATNAGNPTESAQIFKAWLGQRNVLFPKSEQSLNTYSSVIPMNQKTEIIVYRTTSISKLILPCDLYIFSSPSNAKAFLEHNQLPNEANCLAWGSSTTAFLTSRDIPVFHQLQTGKLQELDQFLTNFLELNSDSNEI